MRVIFSISLLFTLLFSQARVGEMQSITSSLDVQTLIASEDEIILATRGGLAFYNINSGEYQVFTKDHGLSDTDLNTVLKGPKGYIWLGSDGGVQIWDINQEKLADWFELDIEEVTKFVTYNNMVYGAIKQAGIWGIMEFIHSNDRIYYRDFYGRNDIEKIYDIVKFGDHLILSTDRGLLAGNPHDIHPLYWSNPFPEIQTSIIALDQRDDELAIVTSDAIYSVKLGGELIPLVTNEVEFNMIHTIAVAGPQNYTAVSDSVIYRIGNDKFEKQFSDAGYHFSSIFHYNSNILLGTSLGFALFDGNTFNHIAWSEPIVNSPDIIYLGQNKSMILASQKGISILEEQNWKNVSTVNYTLGLSTQIDLDYLNVSLGSSISELVENSDGSIYLGMEKSTSGGILLLDIKGSIQIRDLFISPRLLQDKSGKYPLFTINAMTFDKNNNLWVLSRNQESKPLSVHYENQWRNFSFEESGNLLSESMTAITEDNFNRIWLGSTSQLVMYKYSGDVFSPTNEVWISEEINTAALNSSVLDLNVSFDNRLWILTPAGLIYKDLQVSETNPVNQTGPKATNSEIYPYFPNVAFNNSSRIRFDPRGNIWITSQSGVHIVSENGEYWPDINGLNESNSFILSDDVKDVAFDGDEGLAYIATNKGVSVIKIPFAEKKKTYNSVIVFPSPFRIPSSKPMTVDGLKDNSSIKIMTLNGEILRSIPNSEVQGYQAYWDGRDQSGQLVGTGVYLVAIYDKNGASSFEKVAVIRE